MNPTRAQIRRLYWLDAALQGGQYPNAAGLARELHVSRGTIHRDLQILRTRFRAPVAFDPSRGGYAYGRPFQPDLPDLPAEEALRLAGNLLRRGEIESSALGASLHRLSERVASLLPHPPPAPQAGGGTRRLPRVRRADRPVEKGEPTTILLRFDRAVAPEVLQSGLFRRGEIQLLTDGGIEAATSTSDTDTLLLDLLHWAPNFEIAAPPWVRRRLPQLLRRLLKQLDARRGRRPKN